MKLIHVYASTNKSNNKFIYYQDEENKFICHKGFQTFNFRNNKPLLTEEITNKAVIFILIAEHNETISNIINSHIFNNMSDDIKRALLEAVIEYDEEDN